MSKEIEPFAPSGFAAGSLRSTGPRSAGPSTRVLATACDPNLMLMLFVDETAAVKVDATSRGFTLALGRTRHRFECCTSGPAILRRVHR